jgi:hypothetical protein
MKIAKGLRFKSSDKPMNRNRKVKKKSVKKGDPETLDPLWLAGFTSYPPAGDFTPEELTSLRAYKSYPEVDFNFSLAMRLRGEEFKETRNPLVAIEAILEADRKNFYPPLWVLGWLVNGFRKFRDSNGKDKLDTLLGFGSRRRQRLNLFQRESVTLSNKHYLGKVVILNLLGIKLWLAFDLVSKKHETVSAKTLKKLYFSRKGVDRDRDKRFWAEGLKRMTDVEKEQFKNYYLK